MLPHPVHLPPAMCLKLKRTCARRPFGFGGSQHLGRCYENRNATCARHTNVVEINCPRRLQDPPRRDGLRRQENGRWHRIDGLSGREAAAAGVRPKASEVLLRMLPGPLEPCRAAPAPRPYASRADRLRKAKAHRLRLLCSCRFKSSTSPGDCAELRLCRVTRRHRELEPQVRMLWRCLSRTLLLCSPLPWDSDRKVRPQRSRDDPQRC